MVGQSSAQDLSIQDPRFGAVEAFWAPEEAAELGLGWERILFYWREIQPTGPDDWNTLHVLEEWLDEAALQGRTVVGLLKNTAPWASEDGTEAGLPIGLYLPPDDAGNLWANFVRRVAEYYRVRGVHHWIIWNEPEIARGVYGFEFAGTTRDYFQLLKVAYLVMKEVDPAAVIHMAGLTWWHDPDFLRQFLEVVTTDPLAKSHDYYFDTISLHIYFRPETIPTILESVNELQGAFGLSKPVWINETNAPPNLDPLWPVNRPVFPIDLEQQAWYVAQAFALGFASGASHMAVYKMIDVQLPEGGESFGLLRPDYSQRPAYEAYKTTIRFLGNFSDTRLQRENAFIATAFAVPDGVTRVLWSRSDEDTVLEVQSLADEAVSTSTGGQSLLLKAEGGQYTISLGAATCRGECLLGGPPIFLFERGAVLSDLLPEVRVAQDGAIVSQPATFTPTPTMSPTATNTATSTPTKTPGPTDTPTLTTTPLPAIASPTQTPMPSRSLPQESAPDDETVTRRLELAAGLRDYIGLLFMAAGVGGGLAILLMAAARRNR